MSTHGKKNARPTSNDPAGLTPERAQTDEGLRVERTNADAAVTKKRAAERTADTVVTTARTKADAVLESAREKADGKVGSVETAVGTFHGVVEEERAREDAVLKHERATADARLRHEREQQAVLVESVMEQERAKTDRYLLNERDRSDDAIAYRDDFLGMVSHDLRNHLNCIALEAQHGETQVPDSTDGRRIAEVMMRIQRHARQMAGIVDDLTDVVGIEAGKLVVRPQPDDASVLLNEAANSFRGTAAEARVSLTVERGSPSLQACFDHRRMLQVLSNFLSNAIKFTPPGGRVVLRGECDDEELRLSVSDTGAGIPAHMLEAVFERFWQVGENDQRGLGLGLYISRSIVEAHHGTIRVQSRSGEGSIFMATIPVSVSASPRPSPLRADQTQPQAGQSHRPSR